MNRDKLRADWDLCLGVGARAQPCEERQGQTRPWDNWPELWPDVSLPMAMQGRAVAGMETHDIAGQPRGAGMASWAQGWIWRGTGGAGQGCGGLLVLSGP